MNKGRAAKGIQKMSNGNQTADATIQILLDKSAEGFEIRKRRINSKPISSSHHSSVGDDTGSLFSFFEARASRMAGRQSAESRQRNRWIIVSAALSSSNVSAQIRLMENVAPKEDRNFNLLYGVGACLVEPDLDLEAITHLSAPDVSIVLESICNFKDKTLRVNNERLIHFIRKLSLDNWAEITSKTNVKNENTDELSINLGKYSDYNKEGTLAGLRATVSSSKRKSLHLFGPDFFTIIQLMADPRSDITADILAQAHDLFQNSAHSGLFAKLLLARMLGNYPQERNFIKQRYKTLFKELLADRQFKMIERLLDNHLHVPPIRSTSQRWTRRLAYVVCRINNALNSFNSRNLIDAIIDLYELDPDLVNFIDWEHANSVISSSILQTNARTAFVTFLMNSSDVRSRFPTVYLAVGMGSLIGDLTAMLDPTSRRDPVSVLLGRTKDLPPRCAKALTRAIIERNIVERIATTQNTYKIWPKELPPINETKLSLTRLNALQETKRLRLLSDAEVEKQTNAEVDRLRMEYFESKRRTGRVRVAWTQITQGTKSLADFDEPVIRALTLLGSADEIQQPFVRDLADILAKKITNYILFASDASVDQAISNNLRHGIVLPRFLRAFDDAYETTFRRGELPSWDDESLKRSFGANTSCILDMRDDVSDRIKAFLDNNLTFLEGGAFESEVTKSLNERIIRHFTPSTAKNMTLESALSREAEKAIKKFLSAASRELGDVIEKDVSEKLKEVRRTLGRDATTETTSFLDLLETNLTSAFGEVRQWIGLNSERTEVVPFRASEVVQLHLISTALFSIDKLRVRTFIKRNGLRQADEAEPRFKGKYLEMFEAIVHNLFSNAFAYSGDGLKTELTFEIDICPTSVSFTCANTINHKVFPKVLAKHASTVAHAQLKQTDLARRDKASGFQKVRIAVTRALDVEPKFDIPVPDKRELVYNVKFDIAVRASSELES